VSQYQKNKTNLDLLEQETVSGSGIRWPICKSTLVAEWGFFAWVRFGIHTMFYWWFW